MHVKKKTTDIAAVKNATDMSDAQEVRGAWFGLAISLLPVIIISLLIILTD